MIRRTQITITKQQQNSQFTTPNKSNPDRYQAADQNPNRLPKTGQEIEVYSM